jgi:two-component system sensor histidine kinase KdpD
MPDPTSRAAPERRPSPKTLLELAANETRGKLKVFLGMAPGVGKTYAMLAAARAMATQGDDVLVGVVETHGRTETAALLDGLKVLPRKPVDYRRRSLMEFDVEAAIAAKPRLLLVDEFAHTNAPGLMHAKRFQDVEEILRNGIDVWTTLNIQHLESLQDVVEKITGVRVQETVPDKVIEAADEIVVIDLPPEELIQRLKEGKVYLPDNARRAVDTFFRLGNLTALRELALRRTADRVDEQMLAQLRREGVEGPWPTAERILVCVGNDANAEGVVRTAARIAAAQKMEWIALHVRETDREGRDRQAQRRADKAMRLAERLGAQTARIIAGDRVGETLAYARRNNITQAIVGRSERGWVARLRPRAFWSELIRRAEALPVLVVAPPATMTKAERTLTSWISPVSPQPMALVAAVAAVAMAVLVGAGLERVAQLPNMSLVFLLAVLACGMTLGTVSAIVASGLSFLAYNFFFIAPRYTFTVAEPHELLALSVFLVVAFVTGSLAGRLKEHAAATREKAATTEALFDFARKLSSLPKLEDVLFLLASQLATLAKGRAIVLLDRGQGLNLEMSWPPDDELATQDWAAARWAHARREAAGRGTGTLPSARYQFRPLVGASGSLGAVGIEFAESEDVLGDTLNANLQSFIEQAATAIDRISLVEQAAEARTSAEAERLRAALLSSLSHDLRTPLASIVGSITSLRTLGDKMPKSDQSELLATIEEEAGRLSRFVTNLLDMTRLEAGAVDIRRDLVDVGEAAASAVERARKIFPNRKVVVSAAQGLPLILGEAALVEQVIFNLLDNAHKYSPPGSATEVNVTATPVTMTLSVSDRGIGIPQDALEKVFEKFYRVAGSDGRAAGTGLGLSICAGIVKGMGGDIRAESPIAKGKGTRITITWPVPARAAQRGRPEGGTQP